jgi:signal transduction histidine kinase
VSERDALADLLAFRAMPEVAGALRAVKEPVLKRWQEAVEQLLPDADPLTAKEVRDTIPDVLDQLIKALDSNEPGPTDTFIEITHKHGTSRFHQAYNVHELIVEYRLLRRILTEEVQAAMAGALTVTQVMALDMGIDIALQQSVVEFITHLREELGATAEAQSKYMAFLSHDLRNNLGGILLTMELLSMRLKRDESFKEEVDDIARLRRSASETIEGMDRLLQAERLRKTSGAPRRLEVAIEEVVRDVISQHAARAAEKGLKIEMDVPPGAVVESDRELIKLALQNLVGNAVKYSAKGVVRIEAAREGEGWALRVHDQGPGIAPDRLGKLFDAFARGDTHGQPGMGLGLTIAAESAKALGGRLTVDSHPGDGATFRLHLP